MTVFRWKNVISFPINRLLMLNDKWNSIGIRKPMVLIYI